MDGFESSYIERLREMRPKTEFGRWLQRQMLKHRPPLTMGALEQKTGIAKTLISEYLRLHRHPSPRTARRFAEYFGVDVNEVLAMLPGIAEEPAHYIATSRPLEGYGPQELRDIARALERAAQILEEQERQRRDQN